MPITLSLRNIAEELEILPDEGHAYLNRETGELRMILREETNLAEEETDLDKLPEWQRELVVNAREVFESNDWVQLPTKFDIHEWEIMDKFALSLENESLQNRLRNTIRKKGAFRHFKDTVHRYDLQDQWYAFKTAAMERIVANWLDDHGIAYHPDKKPNSVR